MGCHPPRRRLEELFAAQVARNGEATALIFGDVRLSYGELERRANRLARHRRTGTGPGSGRPKRMLRRPAFTRNGNGRAPTRTA